MSVSTIKIETDFITLMDVLNQTGNPTVAIQILNGTYQQPDICRADKARAYSKKDELVQMTFKSYDRFKDEVTYYRSGWGHDTIGREEWNKLQLWSEYQAQLDDMALKLDSQAHEHNN